MVRAHCPQHSSVHNKYCIENSNQIQSLDLHFNQIWEDFLSIDPPVWTVFSSSGFSLDFSKSRFFGKNENRLPRQKPGQHSGGEEKIE